MSGVIDDLAEDSLELDHTYVKRRADDWNRRIALLYENVAEWLGSTYSMHQNQSVLMNENMMKHYDVAPIRLPILEIFKDGKLIGKMVPGALWIIGANGRIDLFSGSKQFVVVDRSNDLGIVDWQVSPVERRRDLRRLDEAALRDILAA